MNRVVLLSDGQANEGVTDRPTLGRIAAGAADRGVRLTTVGMGLDYNEDLMELLAENGRGRYYYVKDAASLEGVFAGELASMQATVASATELQLTPLCAGVEMLEVFGYETRAPGRRPPWCRWSTCSAATAGGWWPSCACRRRRWGARICCR